MTFPATSQSAQPASVLPQPTVVRREDYREPDWLAEGLVLHFALDAQDTVVTAACRYRRRPGAAADVPLRLDGEALEKEIARSKAVGDMAGKIIDNARVVLEGEKLRAEYGGRNFSLPKMLEAKNG